MSYTDFKEVKASTTLDRVASWLGLRTHNNRTQCPISQGDKRELVIDHKRDRFWCYGCKRHATKPSDWCGDMIQLVAHIQGTDQKAAALAIQKEMATYTPANGRGLPADGLSYLQPDHVEVAKLGLDTQTAAILGIGFASRGTMRNHVLFPIRDKAGQLLGYYGAPPGTKLKLPSSFKEPSS